MAQYDEDIASALALIKESGMPVIWRQNAKVDDVVQPWKQADTPPVEFAVDIVFFPTKRVGKTTTAPVAGDVAGGTETAYMGAVPFEPSDLDTIIRAGVTLRIKTIDKLAPNGQAILYTIEVAE